jgi:hypothetical protein
MEAVEVFALLKPVAEQVCGVDDDSVEKLVELLVVYSVASFHLAIETRRGRLYVAVADPEVQHVPVK